MNEGFILIHRKIIKEWEWYSNTNDTRLWLHCLLSANWQDGWFEGIKIERGSFVTSLQKMSSETKLTQRQIRTSLEHLKSTNNLSIKSNHQFSIITINNYDKYQITTNETTNERQTSDKRKTNERQTSDNNIINNNKEQLITINKNKDNIYNVENDIDVYKEIIDYLNMRIGSNYKDSTKKTRDLIKARLNEKFTIDDFKIVIDKMCVEWMNSEMQKYLRPETLFGTKFESYLNREVKQTTRTMSLTTDDIKDLFN